jgi:hypothetical protein
LYVSASFGLLFSSVSLGSNGWSRLEAEAVFRFRNRWRLLWTRCAFDAGSHLLLRVEKALDNPEAAVANVLGACRIGGQPALVLATVAANGIPATPPPASASQ